MNHLLGIARRRVIEVLLITAVVMPFTHSRAVADPDDAYKKLPGYVDFAAMGVFGDAEAKVEVFLKGPLLKMAIEALRHEDPDLVEVLAGVQLVRVHVFEMDGPDYEAIRDKTEKAVRDLEKKGWEVAVRVREKHERITIHMLPGKNDEAIDGLVVTCLDEYDEALFVNIVGTLRVEDIGKILNAFDDGFDINVSDSDDDDDGDRREKRNRRRANERQE